MQNCQACPDTSHKLDAQIKTQQKPRNSARASSVEMKQSSV